MADIIENTKEEGHDLYELGFHLISSLASERAREVFSTLKSEIEKNATITSEASPTLIDLAYEMSKDIDRKRHKFTTAYFGHITFDTNREVVESVKALVDKNESVLRYIIVKTVPNAEEAADRMRKEAEEKDEKKEGKSSESTKTAPRKAEAAPVEKSEAAEVADTSDEPKAADVTAGDDIDKKIDSLVE